MRATRPDPAVAAQRWNLLPAAALLLALTASCGDGAPRNPGDLALAPDAIRDGRAGRDGPHGAGIVTLTAQARVSESIDIDVVYPADGEARLDHAGAPYPAVVLVQEDSVGVERYRWIGVHLASRGYVVLAPRHSLSQSSLQPENAVIALRALRDAAGRTGALAGAVTATGRDAIMGHGAGASTAVRAWTGGAFDALGVLAGVPSSSDQPSARAGSPVLDLVGDQDRARGGLPAYTAGFASFAPPRVFGIVAGMNHWGWTDDASDRELSGDGTATRDVTAARADALSVLDTWLDAYLALDASARTSIETGSFANVTVTR